MPLPHLRLISTDFDGTIVDWRDGTAYPSAAFFEVIGPMQRAGTAWAINTGRSIPQLEETLTAMQFPVQPDYIITLERAVHRRSDAGDWEDFGDWNEKCVTAHDELHQRAVKIFAEIMAYAGNQRGMMTPAEKGVLEGLIATNEAQMDEAVEFLQTLQPRLPELSFQRNSVYLRLCHVDYHKGSVLTELARLLEIGPDAIFAAGDNFNDLPMLDGISAAWVACPGNAVPEVQALVRKKGGYLSRQPAGDGVAEALRAWPWGVGKVES